MYRCSRCGRITESQKEIEKHIDELHTPFLKKGGKVNYTNVIFKCENYIRDRGVISQILYESKNLEYRYFYSNKYRTFILLKITKKPYSLSEEQKKTRIMIKDKIYAYGENAIVETSNTIYNGDFLGLLAELDKLDPNKKYLPCEHIPPNQANDGCYNIKSENKAFS